MHQVEWLASCTTIISTAFDACVFAISPQKPRHASFEIKKKTKRNHATNANKKVQVLVINSFMIMFAIASINHNTRARLDAYSISGSLASRVPVASKGTCKRNWGLAQLFAREQRTK